MDTIKLLDGSIEIIDSSRDFSDLIDRKLGADARRWFDDFVEDYKATLEYVSSLELQIEDARSDYDGAESW